MGANGPNRQEECYRGHELVDANTAPATGGGRRCRACSRALSMAYNWEHRRGEVLTPEEVDALADKKYMELVPSARCRAITYTNSVNNFIIRCTLLDRHNGSHV